MIVVVFNHEYNIFYLKCYHLFWIKAIIRKRTFFCRYNLNSHGKLNSKTIRFPMTDEIDVTKQISIKY